MAQSATDSYGQSFPIVLPYFTSRTRFIEKLSRTVRTVRNVGNLTRTPGKNCRSGTHAEFCGWLERAVAP